jgi:hypothetical protein
VEVGKEKKKSVSWRKKTDDPFWNETGIVGESQKASQQSQTEQQQQQQQPAPKSKLTDGQFKNACDRLKRGESDVYGLILDTFTVSDIQKSELIKLYNDALKMGRNSENKKTA